MSNQTFSGSSISARNGPSVLSCGLTKSTAGVVVDTWDRVNPIRLRESAKLSGIISSGDAVALWAATCCSVDRIATVGGAVVPPLTLGFATPPTPVVA